MKVSLLFPGLGRGALSADMKATQTHAVSSPCQRRLGAALKHKLCANVTLNFCSLAPISFCAWIRRELRRLFCQIWNLCWSEKCQPLFVPVIAVTAGFSSVGGLCGGAGDLCLVPPALGAADTAGAGDALQRLFALAACPELDVRMASSRVWAPWCVESLLFAFFNPETCIATELLALCFTT